MSIKTKILSIVLGLSLVVVMAPAAVEAALTQAQVDAIISLLQSFGADATTIANVQTSLTGGTPGGATPVPTGNVACSGVSFTRNLTVGSTGSDVKCLQVLLNTNGYTLAATGAGSPGMETSYFGPITLAAVRSFQTAHGWTPANQVGPLTREALNALIAGTPGTPGTPPVIVPTGAGLSVMLASDNPASGTIVDGQALYPLTKLVFVNGDNAEVKVTQLKLKRIGVSADGSLVSTYLFNGATRLTDGASVSSTIISFNNASGLFTVPAGGSKTISVLSDVNGSASETFGIQLVSSADVTTNASSVKGTYPITGNLHTLASGTLAGVEFNATTTPSSAATIDPQNDYPVWQNSVIVTTRAVDMTRISFRKTGSIKDADLQNFKLYVDGVQVGSAVPNIVLNANAESLITFDLTSSPKRLETGTRVIKLVADIIGGSSLTFTFNLWNSADVTLVDSQYMANVLPDLISDASFTKRSTAEMTIGSGTITITKMTDSPTGNIVNNASNALLAKFQIKAAGEAVKIETLYVSANVNTSGVSGLRNGALYANGIQIGSTTTLYDTADSSYDYTTYSLGSSLIVTPGSPVTLEVKADIYDTGTSDTTNSIIEGSTIQVVIEGSGSWNNGTGMVSASTVDVPATDVNGNTLTVAEGGLTLSQDTGYSAHSVVAPLTNYKIADYNLAANTTEAVNITAINITLDEVSSYMSNLYVKYGTQTTTTKASISSTGSETWNINYTLPAGTTIPVEVYADVSSSMSTGTGTVAVDVDGITVSSAATADSASTTTGQALTYTSGAFNVAFSSTPQNQVVAGGQQVEIGRWRFTTSYQAYTITELKIDPDITTGSASGASPNAEFAISQLVLKDGSTVLATKSFNAVDTYGSTGGFFFTGLNIVVPASTSKTLTVDAILATPISGYSGLRVIPSLTYVKAMDPQGTITEEIDHADDANKVDGNSTYVYKAVPTITKEALTSTKIVNGSAVDMFKFRVAAPTQGDVFVKQFRLDLSWSDGGTGGDTLELESVQLWKDGTDITSLVTISNEDDGVSAEGNSDEGVTETNSKLIVTWDSTTEDTISAGTSTVYTIRATPDGFNEADGDLYSGLNSVAISFNTDSADVGFFDGATYDAIGYLNTDSTAQVGSQVSLYSGYTASTSAEQANLIWSDGSATAHTAVIGNASTSTNDWTNSYLLKSSLTPQAWTD